MRNRIRSLAGIVVLAACLPLPFAAAFEVGDYVVVARSCEVTRDGAKVDDAQFGQVAEIEAMEGGRLWLNFDRCGWVDMANVVAADEGDKILSSRIEKNPEDWEALVQRSSLRGSQDKLDAALADINAALRIYPSSRVYTARGWIMAAKKDEKKALADCERALQLNPTNIRALVPHLSNSDA